MNQPIQAPAAPAPHQELVEFPELWRTFSRYKWGVLGLALVGAVATALYAFSLQPVYQATASILIELHSERPVQIQDVYDPALGSIEYYGTQIEIIQSRSLASKVVDRLALVDHPEFNPSESDTGLLSWLPPMPNWRRWLSSGRPQTTVELDPEALKRQAVIDAFLKRVSVEAQGRTRIVRVSFKAESPKLAADVANALADAYIESGLEARLDATERASSWLTEKVSDIRTKLEQSERALQAYREQHGLVNVGGERGLYDDALVDSARRLRDAQKRKTELASTYAKIQQAAGDPQQLANIGSLLSDPLVQKSNENYLQAREAVKQLQERYGERHPQMTVAKARLDAARQAYFDQLKIASQALKAEYEIAAENARQFSSVVDEARDEIRSLDRQEFQLSQLERDVETNRQLYDLFLTRFKETSTTSTFEPITAQVVDRAIVPTKPSEPNKRKMVLLGLFGGLFLGILLAVVRHLLDETVSDLDEVERATELPVLGVLPQLSGKQSRNLFKLFSETPRVPYAEGIRSVRAALHLSDVDARFKRLMITSSLPREGKSSLTATLGLALSSMERTVLIEGDLRAPSLARMIGIPKGRPGLCEYLTGQASLDECLYVDESSGLSVLAVSKPPPNPAEIVASGAFSRLVDDFSQRFDRVLIDTPPVQAAADAQAMLRQVDAVVFVIRADATHRRAIRRAVAQLRQSQAVVLGSVLNGVDVRKRRADFGGYYYAYEYYGKR